MRFCPYLLMLSLAVFGGASVIAEERLSEAEAIAKIKSLGGNVNRNGPRGVSINLEPIPFAVVPYWTIVIPLTLLSGYLLLSKSQSKKLNQDAA